MQGRTRRVTQEEHELSALLAERDRVINALQELDFDYKLGKIPKEARQLRRRLVELIAKPAWVQHR